MYKYGTSNFEPSFEQEFEFENEFEGENDFEDEFNPNEEFESDPSFEYEGDYEFEDEFENEFEDEVRVRDHRSHGGRGRPGNPNPYRRPVSAVRTRPAYRTQHRYKPSHYSSANRYRSTNYRPSSNRSRHGWPWQHKHPRSSWHKRYQGTPYFPDQSGMNAGADFQQPGNTFNTAADPGQQGGFKNFVMDAIRNLTSQIAAGNEAISSLKNSITASASSAPPMGVDPGPGNVDPASVASPQPGTPSSEFEMEDFETFDSEFEEESGELESSFEEDREMELASELLNLNNESELDHFFGKLLEKAVGGISNILKSPQGQILKRVLKKIAKKALPAAGTAAGAFFGGPLGAKLGSDLGNTASNMFELELEGLSNEDREFEVARAVVRLSGNAARQLTRQDNGHPGVDAKQALVEASTLYAPGLLAKRQQEFEYDTW